jgi:class 3 adenylate cyclase
VFAPALEAKYRAEVAAESIGTHRIIFCVAAFIWAALALHDPWVAGTPGNLEMIRSVRWITLVPLVLVAAAGWLPAPLFVRLRMLVQVVGVSILLTATLAMAALIPDPLATEPLSASVAIVVTIFVTCMWCGALSLPLWVPIGGTLLQTLGWWLLRDKFPGRQDGGVLVWFTLSTLLGWLAAWLLVRARRRLFKASHALEREQARSEQLLRNVLPESIAARLKSDPARIADHFPTATILFGDIVGFTTLSESLPPGELVAALDALFSKFDDLAKKFQLEKIKTIGDAYMVVGGVPEPRPDHAEAIARMALEMRDLAANETFAGKKLKMRIGIASGPVVAGVIGKQKFIYDLWGDAVNTASRMESHGLDGTVQVNEAAWALLKGTFDFNPRGTIEVKGKGQLRTWILVGMRPGQHAVDTVTL